MVTQSGDRDRRGIERIGHPAGRKPLSSCRIGREANWNELLVPAGVRTTDVTVLSRAVDCRVSV